MRRLALPLLILTAATAFAAPAPFPKPQRGKDDLARLQGKWVITSGVCCGDRYAFADGCIVTIKGDTIKMEFQGGFFPEYRLRPSGEPGTLDMIREHYCCRYRYRRQGDSLSLRTFGGDEPRPASLNATRRDGYYIHEEWRRVR